MGRIILNQEKNASLSRQKVLENERLNASIADFVPVAKGWKGEKGRPFVVKNTNNKE